MVYVDDMHLSHLGHFGRMKMCHMLADSDEELRAMAERIGVALKWHQHAGTHRSHFDIATAKRVLAVAAGAKEITMRDAGLISRRRRNEFTFELERMPIAMILEGKG